jgi:hypothetical protein
MPPFCMLAAARGLTAAIANPSLSLLMDLKTGRGRAVAA